MFRTDFRSLNLTDRQLYLREAVFLNACIFIPILTVFTGDYNTALTAVSAVPTIGIFATGVWRSAIKRPSPKLKRSVVPVYILLIWGTGYLIKRFMPPTAQTFAPGIVLIAAYTLISNIYTYRKIPKDSYTREEPEVR